MSEKYPVELDSEFISKFFELADMPPPDSVDAEKLNEVLGVVKGKVEAALSLSGMAAQPQGVAPMASEDGGVGAPSPAAGPASKSVLVVDDLGIVVIQLETLLKKLGFQVTVSKELFDAIDKFKTQDFGYAIVDLFIPTEREGFTLVDEIKKLSLLCKLNTKIVVMSASNKKEHRENALNRGADHFIEKAAGWQERIMNICQGKGE